MTQSELHWTKKVDLWREIKHAADLLDQAWLVKRAQRQIEKIEKELEILERVDEIERTAKPTEAENG